MHPAVLLERTVVGIVHAHLVPDRAQDRLLGEGVGTELEGDLVHQDSPVPASCLKGGGTGVRRLRGRPRSGGRYHQQRQYDSGTVLAPSRVRGHARPSMAASVRLRFPYPLRHSVCMASVDSRHRLTARRTGRSSADSAQPQLRFDTLPMTPSYAA